jgi:hypothetical protein
MKSATEIRARTSVTVRKLQDRLQSTRRIQIRQRIGIGLCLFFIGGAIALLASAIADSNLELTFTWRAAWLAGVSLVIAVGMIIGWRRWVYTYTLSDTAADAEQQLTQFGQRLRTTLDYEQRIPAPAAASQTLLNSLHDETFALAEQTEWSSAIDSRPLLKTVLAASAVAFGWIVALVLMPEFRVSAARAMLLPLEYTTVTYTPQSATIRPGESVSITVTISGRPVTSASLRYRPSGSDAEWTTVEVTAPGDVSTGNVTPDGRDVTSVATGNVSAVNASAAPVETAEIDSTPAPLHGELTAKLDELTQDVEFEVLAGPRPLPSGFVRVLQPLRLDKFEARIVPPSYLGRDPETVESLELKVFEGSTVELKFDFNRPASQIRLVRLVPPGDQQSNSDAEAAPAAEAAPDATEISLEMKDARASGTLFDLRKSTTFTLSGRTADGMLLDPVQIRVRVQLDRKPQLNLIEPQEELVVTPTTEVPVIVEASDDLGLYKVGVMYQVGSGPMQSLLEQSADGSVDPYRMATELLLEDHSLSPKDAVTYYAFAEDNYFGEPRRTTTPLRFIDIRPYKIAFQVIDQEGQPCSGSVTLEELITRQRDGLSQVFQANQQSLSKPIAARLSESQEELLEATIEFAAGLAARGAEVPSLDEAATHMESAITSLDALELPAAVSSEQQALAALIAARENVRKILNQANSQSASACRKFDRQQRQKLRLPEKKKSDQQQQLAQARKQLDDLAKRERKWSQQAQQSCSPSGSSSGKPSQSSPSQSSPSQSTPSQSKPSPSGAGQSQASESQPSTAEQPNSDQNSGENSESTPPSPAEIAAEQEKLKAELAELQKQLDKLDANGQAAREQAQQAAESMQQGLEHAKNMDGNAAAKEGERAAEQLEQLSEHLAAMNARDFGQRLDQAQKAAEQLASQQGSLARRLPESKAASAANSQGEQAEAGSKKGADGKSPAQNGNDSHSGGTSGGEAPGQQPGNHSEGLARDQQALAAQTELLADLLDKLMQDASGEAGGIQQSLQQAQAETPPRDIAAGMRQTADDLREQRTTVASQGATRARDQLQELSKSLSTARGEFAQPQLKELLALEEQLAQLQQQLKRAQASGVNPSTAEKWRQLESRLDKMAAADERLAAALRQLRQGPPNQDSGTKPPAVAGSNDGGTAPPKPGSQLRPTPFVESDGQMTPEGFYSWLELGNFNGMREVSKALQMKIQEAILAGALMDADQPVPAAYKELVEKYYRSLSDDLR